MKKAIGIVREVYLPDELIGGEPVLELHKHKIGFMVEIKGKIIKYEEPQNTENAKIHKGDKVVLLFDLAKSKSPVRIEVYHE